MLACPDSPESYLSLVIRRANPGLRGEAFQLTVRLPDLPIMILRDGFGFLLGEVPES